MDITDEIFKVNNVFESISTKIVNEIGYRLSISFNIKDLPDHKNFSTSLKDIENSKYIYRELDEIRCDCLYWFELGTKEEAKKLNARLNEYRASNSNRSVPATNKNKDSNVLYVGIRRGGYTKKWETSNITNRINQHLGYYHSGNTQGLQLIHFAKDCDFDIRINVVKIESTNSMYLNIIEKLVAQKLKPLCGRH
ncbi:GIY-YIG nuclease family protein [Aquimarina sp. MMG016]|uniref:GIY-YIG nuclease family protein n=1 Tax=Aquimarina sp. MMG016 TaxID=2822690 RepID=UPI001B39F7B4|nr:GIY-YIG nuclease family protein [Aquimarina sp. MMG016]MBQ4819475.1 GIY-YIG nuclease family protein [Aquimarina sp. MMG016]